MADSKGIKRLLQLGRKRFRLEENTRYYSRKAFKEAEKRFLIECVLRDPCRQ